MNILIENGLDEQIPEPYFKVIEDAVHQSVEAMAFPEDYEVSVTLVSKEEIRQINSEYRNKDAVTDVLSFPLLDYDKPGDFENIHHTATYTNHEVPCIMLGDIVICYERAIEQAEDYGHSIERELSFLTVHSMLHLFGYDHMNPEDDEVMTGLQRDILDGMGMTR